MDSKIKKLNSINLFLFFHKRNLMNFLNKAVQQFSLFQMPCNPCCPPMSIYCFPCCSPCAAPYVPCAPCGPCMPCGPCGPCGPCTPCGPCGPCSPCGPRGPCCPPPQCCPSTNDECSGDPNTTYATPMCCPPPPMNIQCITYPCAPCGPY